MIFRPLIPLSGGPSVISAEQADPAGGDVSIVTVSNTSGVTAVTIGGTSSTFFTVSATKLAVITPAKAVGSYNVAVTNGSGTGTLTNGITYFTNVDANTTLRLQRGNYIGDTFSDDSGNARHFTNATLYPGETNKEPQFTQTSTQQLASAATVANVLGTTTATGDTFSMSFMFRMRAINAPAATYYESDAIFVDSSVYVSLLVTDSWTRFMVYPGAGSPFVEIAGSLSVNDWHVVDVENSNGQLRMRIDGGAWTSTVSAGGPGGTTGTLNLAWPNNAAYGKAKVDIRGLVISNVARGDTWFDQNLTWWKVKHGFKSAAGEPEIDSADSDVFDPAGGDRVFVRGRNLTGASGYVGDDALTNVKTFGAMPDHNGINNKLALSVNRATLLGGSGWSFSALVNFQGLAADAGALSNQTLFSETLQYVTIEVFDNGLRLLQFNAAGTVLSSVTAYGLTSGWHLVQARWTGTQIQVRIDGGAWSSAAQTEIGGSGTFRFGSNYSGTNYFLKGPWAEALFADSSLSDATMDNIVAGVNNDYGLNLGGVAASAFDRASLSLTAFFRPGNYVSGTWTGLASAGGSLGRDATEATNPPRVSDGEHLVATMPAKSAGTYPLTLVNASGEASLTDVIQYANPGTIANNVWWLRANDASTVTTSGGLVTQWRDQSGAGDANRHVAPPGADMAAWAQSPEYGGKYTIGPFHTVGTANRLTSGVWSTSYASPFTLGAIGEKSSNAVSYFVFGSTTDYHALVHNGGNLVMYNADASELHNAPFDVPTRSSFLGVFNAASSRLYRDAGPATGPGTIVTASILGDDPVDVGSYGGADTSSAHGAGKIAEVYAYSRALTFAEVRTLRRYRDSYYGKAA